MLASDIPYKIPAPFSSSDLANATIPIPTAAQPNGFASWSQGWGIVNATNPGAGGIPPRWQDFKGLFYICSAWLQWAQAGGAPVFYDASFQSTIGGYPKGAIVGSVTTAGLFWRSIADNNTSNPDTGGANWVPFPTGSLINIQKFTTPGMSTYTPTPGMGFVIACVQGAGSAGAGCTLPSVGNVSIGSAGQSGAYGEGQFTASAIGASLTITVGAGGVGVSGTTGGSGGSSSFGPLLSAPGGAGSTVLNNQVPPTCNGTGTQTAMPTGANLYGEQGGASGFTVVVTSTTTAMVTAPGGRSHFGDGSPPVNGNAVPSTALNPGSGGGGSLINNAWGGNQTGANGANGLVLIYEFS